MARYLSVGLAALILAACGGGGGGTTSPQPAPPPSNAVPVANAGADLSQDISPTGLDLDGSASSDADNDTLTYAWTILSAPANADERLDGANTISPTLFGSAPGDYEIELTVRDPSGASASDTMLATLINQAPRAQIAPYDSDGYVAKAANFDASASSDVNGQTLTYEYEVVTAPSDSNLLGRIYTGAQPDIFFDTSGTFELSMTVSDGFDSDTIRLNPIEILAFEIMNLPATLDRAIYDGDGGRLISIDGSAIVITSTESGTQSRVMLPLPVAALGLSPDGKFAAIGHNARVSFVDLDAGTVIRTESISQNVGHIFMDGDGNAHAVPSRRSIDPTYSINKDTGIVLVGARPYNSFHSIVVHPSGTKAYAPNSGVSPADIIRFSIEEGKISTLRDSPYHGHYGFCGKVFNGPDGRSLLTGCGVVLRASEDIATDMTFLMDLGVNVVDAAMSGVGELWSVIDMANSTQLKQFDASTGNLIDAVPLDNGDGVWTAINVFMSPDDDDVLILAGRGGETALIRRYGRAAKADDFTPDANVSRYNSGRVNQTLTLDGSASTDPQDLSLTYEWTLVSEPAGSSLSLSSNRSDSLSFTPQVAGTYQISLTVDNGTRNNVAHATVNVFAVGEDLVQRIDGGISDAEYSATRNALVYLSDETNEIHMIGLDDRVTRSVVLERQAYRVSVSPDGRHAVASHSGMLSLIDLDTMTVADTQVHSVDWGDIVLSDDRRAHFIPRRDQWVQFYTADFVADTVESVYGARAGTQIRLHPNQQWVYGADRGLSPSDFEKYDISETTPRSLGDSPYHGTYPISGNLWIDEDGQRIIVAGGRVFKSSSDTSEDMYYDGALSDGTFVSWADHSSEKNQWAVAADTSVGPVVYLYSDDFYVRNGAQDIASIPGQDSGDVTRAEKVYYSGDGQNLILLLKGEGLLDSYAIQITE